MSLEKLGPYKIGRQIGRGGMGAVYAATHEETGQLAAVKILIQHLAPMSGFRDRFVAEIESLKRLDHPNIVKLYGFGEQDDVLFYAMEFVAGTSLEEELRAGRRFNWPEVVQFGLDMAKALKHAHDHGIIHRDIKPANLLLSTSGIVKLSDFGIARLFGNSGMTADGSLLGTAEYMAPEQAEGKPVTPSCDLYSLGGVLYALLAGRPPFRSKSLPEMLQLQRFAVPEPVSTFVSGIPAEFERIVMRLLEKEPERRLPDATVLIRQLFALPEILSTAANPAKGVAARERAEPRRAEPGPSDSEVANVNAATRTAEDEVRLAPAHERTLLTAAPEQASDLTGGDAKPSANRPTLASFTPVDAQARRGPAIGKTSSSFFSWQTLLLLLALVALVGLGSWYVQPPSADALFQRIQERAADRDPDRLLDAEDDIRQFLDRYPNDPRQETVESYAQALKLQRSNRRIMLRQLVVGGKASLLPLEREYLAAVELGQRDPERAIQRLDSLLALYGKQAPASTAADSARTDLCLELARAERDRLMQQVASRVLEQQAWLAERLHFAAELAPHDPAAARAIWQAIVDLYGDRPALANQVKQARDELEKATAVDKGASKSE
ncbi:MAG TPA: serine/threonine-protein kinase [Pirellulales bacterium]|jgi:serine/threonine-protein kinase|nr:serine/threonine-protein kinase [Pirellulales bacterium]